VLNWKAKEIEAGRKKKEAHIKPYAFGTSRKYIYNELKGGERPKLGGQDVLWIFSIPMFDKHASLPTLVAKIVIDVVVDRESKEQKEYEERVPDYIKDMWISGDKKRNWQYVVLGRKKESSYYPVNNVYRALRAAVGAKSRPKVPREKDKRANSFLANHFRTIKEISGNAAKKLEAFSGNIDKKNLVFISYRRGQDSKIVRDIVERLSRNNVFCWLDIGRIPQEDEGRFEYLEFFYFEMFRSIDESKAFVALKREDYFTSKWTLLEHCYAIHQRDKRQIGNRRLIIEEGELHKLREKASQARFVKRITEIYRK